MKTYRDTGVQGALLDEYEKALEELKATLADITDEELKTVVDSGTKDPDCISIQTILAHVIRSGYCYVIEIRRHLGEEVGFVPRAMLDTATAYQHGLDQMFMANTRLFQDYPDIVMEERDPAKKIQVAWGQWYDPEQLFEHAILHILRHRRQIERFLISLRNPVEA